MLTMVGSPNFGYRLATVVTQCTTVCVLVGRSVERDLETQMVVVTSNEGLRDRLQQERDALFNFGTPVTAQVVQPCHLWFESSPSLINLLQTWEEPGRAVPWWVARVVGIARNFF